AAAVSRCCRKCGIPRSWRRSGKPVRSAGPAFSPSVYCWAPCAWRSPAGGLCACGKCSGRVLRTLTDVRGDKTEDPRLIVRVQLVDPAPGRERDLGVGQAGIRLDDDLDFAEVVAWPSGANVLELVDDVLPQARVVGNEDATVLQVVDHAFIPLLRAVDGPADRTEPLCVPVRPRIRRDGVVRGEALAGGDVRPFHRCDL